VFRGEFGSVHLDMVTSHTHDTRTLLTLRCSSLLHVTWPYDSACVSLGARCYLH